jgi:putative flippase GtrA
VSVLRYWNGSRDLMATVKLDQLLRFAVVGAFGFVVDGGLLTVLLSNEWNLFAARALSFSAAVSSTWFLNRRWTFISAAAAVPRNAYMRYFGVQLAGAALNLSIFFVLVLLIPHLKSVPLVPLAVGAAVSLMFNYLVTKYLIFREKHG